MPFTKRQSKFSQDSVYIVVIKKHDEYNPSIGFFHHRKHERGFLAYAEFTSEIRTVKVERSKPLFYLLCLSDRSAPVFTGLTDCFTISYFVKLADFPYSRKCGDLYRPTQAGSTVTEWGNWLCDVLLRLDRQRREGKLSWRYKCDDINFLNKLRIFAPKVFVLLTSLSIFARP